MTMLKKYKYIYEKTEIAEQVEEFIYLRSIVSSDGRSKREHNKMNVPS